MLHLYAVTTSANRRAWAISNVSINCMITDVDGMAVDLKKKKIKKKEETALCITA